MSGHIVEGIVLSYLNRSESSTYALQKNPVYGSYLWGFVMIYAAHIGDKSLLKKALKNIDDPYANFRTNLDPIIITATSNAVRLGQDKRDIAILLADHVEYCDIQLNN